MRDKVVRSYMEQRAEPVQRMIRVVENTTGFIEGWHGGHRLKEFSAFTSVDAAIGDAKDYAERYSVDEKSSLVIRVREEVRHNHMAPPFDEYSSGSPTGRSMLASERHVFDVVKGEIKHDVRRYRWTGFGCIGFRGVEDPGDVVTEIFSVEGIQHLSNEFLYEGYGYRNLGGHKAVREAVTERSIARREIAAEIAGCRSSALIRFTGEIDIFAPPGTPDDVVTQRLLKESAEATSGMDWDRVPGARHFRVFFGPEVAPTEWRRI